MKDVPAQQVLIRPAVRIIHAGLGATPPEQIVSGMTRMNVHYAGGVVHSSVQVDQLNGHLTGLQVKHAGFVLNL